MLRRGGGEMEERLDGLKPGEGGAVTRLVMAPDRAASLIRLGLRPGTEIRCLRRAPLGDPAVYRFRGTTAAIRQKDAREIVIKKGS